MVRTGQGGFIHSSLTNIFIKSLVQSSYNLGYASLNNYHETVNELAFETMFGRPGEF